MKFKRRHPLAMWIRYSPFYLLFWYIIYLIIHATYQWASSWQVAP